MSQVRLATPQRPLDVVNSVFLLTAHLAGVGGIVYMAVVKFSWLTLGLAVLWYLFCGLSITGGYHRLYAHPTYKASWPVRAFYLFFGSASLQNSALNWSADHRRHHTHSDTDLDPYSVCHGFWWAHMGWVLREGGERDLSVVKDLQEDPIARFQHRYYLVIAILAAALAPMAIAGLWGDAMGGLLVAGFTRLIVQWHATFAINSLGHTVGKRTYNEGISARDSSLVAALTLGEGYHNFHHSFPADYRNGVAWWHIDPTKWIIWSLSRVGLTRGLRRTPAGHIQNALERRAARQAAG